VAKRNLHYDSTAEFEDVLKHAANRRYYVLRLFITGTTVRSIRAIANIRSVCEEYLKDRHYLSVVDIYQQPSTAQAEQIIAAPTLIKSEPLPPKRLVGDLSDREKVLVGLGLLYRTDGKAPDA
jgi:circadian clock protein KaiB